ncbi:MAG: CoA-binding protein [Ignavibacteria bacterium]|jgi:predicted CoA-binding protein|nr:CoA-binding protein [Ignavibacteria bacterium]MCU7504414.1 CoA-binding protein [Ignavibacteria bacterium]MCU7517495.1 CoA-binding protein [Ignavibacteria bacterium]
MRSICDILKESRNIAVVGISNKPGRDSGRIAQYLKDEGYNVVGVNPLVKEFPGIKVYSSLKEVPFKIDIVDVFRRSEAIPEIMPDVLEVKPRVLWLQLGIRNDEAVAPASDLGIETIQDKCILVEHRFCR